LGKNILTEEKTDCHFFSPTVRRVHNFYISKLTI
jgi:hypothetical protein